ncbi:MAG: hypothetical protein M3P49_12710 [Actinomycetota bacterium]|nr:hypothetical protein [Actinomycetota bacterium]
MLSRAGREGGAIEAHGGLPEGGHSSRDYIGKATNSNTLIDYLTLSKEDGSVAAAILGREGNVAPPDVTLVGSGVRDVALGRRLCAEGGPVPAFVKDDVSEYRYCGRYGVSHWTEDLNALERWGAASSRDNLTRVIFLRKVD